MDNLIRIAEDAMWQKPEVPEFKAGDTTTIVVWRSGSQLELTITLDEKPHEEAAAEETAPTMPSGGYGSYGGGDGSGSYGGFPDWFFGRGFGG